MFKIGIIGSDNSHADAFSKLVNFKDPKTGEYRYPDCRIVRIFGLMMSAQKRLLKMRSEFIAESNEMMSKECGNGRFAGDLC